MQIAPLVGPVVPRGRREANVVVRNAARERTKGQPWSDEMHILYYGRTDGRGRTRSPCSVT